ncbi:MAG: hypothetical protein VX527_09235 [Planctomycetota bacterium]|nr:hypothetical protein [Planctomycetota bacterium]
MSRSRNPCLALAALFLLLTLLCLYGLLASFEPGTDIWWKIGYGLGIVIFLVLALWSLLRRC